MGNGVCSLRGSKPWAPPGLQRRKQLALHPAHQDGDVLGWSSPAELTRSSVGGRDRPSGAASLLETLSPAPLRSGGALGDELMHPLVTLDFEWGESCQPERMCGAHR